MNIKDIVKNNAARFSFYRAGHMYCEVVVDGQRYRFPASRRFGNGNSIGGTQSDHLDALHSEGAGRPHVRESLIGFVLDRPMEEH
jgi:hypothetical protein